MLPLILSLAIAAAPDHRALETATAQLVSSLDLAGRDILSPGRDLAVAVRAPAAWNDLAPDIARRIAGQLAQLGIPDPIVLVRIEDSQVAADVARQRGAEWLLWVRLEPAGEDRLQLTGSLLDIDPAGLWGPSPSQPSSLALVQVQAAVASTPGPDTMPAPPPGPPLNPRLQVLGRPLRVMQIEGRVLALAACPMPDGPEGLAVLTRDTVQILRAGEGPLRRILQLDLRDLPASETPARDAVGQMICDARRIAFGHSGLAEGHEVQIERPEAPWRTLDGLPVGFGPDETVWVAAVVPGKNQLVAPLASEIVEHPAAGGLEIWPVAYQRSWDAGRPDGYRALSVDLAHRLATGASGGEGTLTTGVGISARSVGDTFILITTSAESPPDQDRVQVHAGVPPKPLGPPQDVEGEVFASKIARPIPGRTHAILAAWRPKLGRTDLLLLEIGAAAP